MGYEGATLPLAPSDTLAALKELYANGLIHMNALKTSAFLTPKGYDAAGREPEAREGICQDALARTGLMSRYFRLGNRAVDI